MSRTYQLLTFETFSVLLPVNNNERVGPSKRSAAHRGGKDAEGCLRELRTTALRGHAPPHCASLQSTPCAGPAKLQVPQSLAAPHNCVHLQQTSGRRLAPRRRTWMALRAAQPSHACKAIACKARARGWLCGPDQPSHVPGACRLKFAIASCQRAPFCVYQHQNASWRTLSIDLMVLGI